MFDTVLSAKPMIMIEALYLFFVELIFYRVELPKFLFRTAAIPGPRCHQQYVNAEVVGYSSKGPFERRLCE